MISKIVLRKKRRNRGSELRRVLVMLMIFALPRGRWRMAAPATSHRCENPATRRTRRPRDKPFVNTRHVEGMATKRKHSDFFSVGELSETNRALRWISAVFGGTSGGWFRGGESGSRKRLKSFLLQPFVLRRRISSGSKSPKTSATYDGGKASYAYESAEKSRQDHHHVRFRRQNLLRRLWWWRRRRLEDSWRYSHSWFFFSFLCVRLKTKECESDKDKKESWSTL